MSVVIIGSIALDSVKTPFATCNEVLGGSATYSSVSASYFTPVKLVGIVGSDFSAKHIQLLRQRKIDLQGLAVKKGETFRWKGEYGWDFSDPRTLSTCLNVFAHFNPLLPATYKRSKYIFLANIDPDLQSKVLTQIRKPKLILCDTMNFWIAHKRKALLKVLKRIDIFLLNESEARQLTQERNLVKAANDILRCGPRRVIIKKGEHGALLFSPSSCFGVPAYLLEDIFDPTGAGDTFAGGIIGYLAQQNSVSESVLRRAIVYGSIMATFAVESFSLRKLAAISSGDIRKRFKEFLRQTCF